MKNRNRPIVNDPLGALQQRNTTAHDDLTMAMLEGDEPQIIERVVEKVVEVVPPEMEMSLVPQGDGTFRYKRFVIASTHLDMPDGVTREEWNEIGQVIKYLESSVQWVAGDWASYAYHTWGTSYDVMAADFGYEVETLYSYASVARSISTLIRNQGLSFAHHRYIAAKTHDLQERWIAYGYQHRLKLDPFKKEVALLRSLPEEDQIRWLDFAIESGELLSQRSEFATPALPAASPLADKKNRRTFNRVWQSLEKGGAVKREDIQHLRRWLDAIEQGLS
jgi:hypothetical protein